MDESSSHPAPSERPFDLPIAVLGGLLTLVLQFVLGLLAASLGLAFQDPSTMGAVAGVLVAVVVLVSAAAGGVAVGLLLPHAPSRTVDLHALGSWALAILTAVVIMAQTLASPLGSLVAMAGGSVALVSATQQERDLVSLVSSLEPVIISHLEIFDGKVITTLETRESAPDLLKALDKSTEALVETLDEDLSETADDARIGFSIGAALASLALLTTGLVTVLAARQATRRRSSQG